MNETEETPEPYVDPSQISMFGDELTSWHQHWGGMPEFDQANLEPVKSIKVHFATMKDLADFARLVEQRLTPDTQSIWYPEAEIGRFADKRYASDDQSPPTAVPEPAYAGSGEEPDENGEIP